jgi:hypothetical protein
MNQKQKDYAVQFWTDIFARARSIQSLPDLKATISRFQRELTLVLKEDPDIKAICCTNGPNATLQLVLQKIELDKPEPPVLDADIDMIFQDNGKILIGRRDPPEEPKIDPAEPEDSPKNRMVQSQIADMSWRFFNKPTQWEQITP